VNDDGSAGGAFRRSRRPNHPAASPTLIPPLVSDQDVTFDHLETDPEAVLDPGGFDTDWAQALEDGDAERARSAFLAAVREGPERTNPETDLIGLRRRWHDDRGFHRAPDPERALEKYHEGVYGIDHQFEDGIDWFYNPTVDSEEYDYTGEWQWQLNRHYRWLTLADRHVETGEARYAETVEEELRDWIASCPRPADSGNYHPSAWRTIETGIRAGWVWPYVFECLRDSDDFSDEALWLWICSYRDHGRHVLDHVRSQNWKTMEANGLAHAGAMFPELDGAGTFLSTAIDRTVAEIERQFYPDGLQTELAPGYAEVSISNTYSALSIAAAREDATRRALSSVPRRSWERFETIAEGYARLATPEGTCPPLHDSSEADVAPIYGELVGGDPPFEREESTLLPWGGYGVLRNEGRYAMLDAGPYGTGHQHQDTLQVLAHAGGEWLLADPGSPQYTDAPETRHIRSAAGHNLVLLDGKRHEVRPERHRTEEPMPVALAEEGPLSATAAARSFETPDATFDHERLLCALSDVGWIVFDRVVPRDDDSHSAEWLWHAPGEWAVDDDGATVAGGNGSLRIEPAGCRSWTAAVAEAERDPLRGWGPTGEDGEPGPLPTLRVESEADTGPVEGATLLSPTGATLVDASFGSERTVTVAGDGETTLHVEGEQTVERVVAERDGEETALALGEHALLAE